MEPNFESYSLEQLHDVKLVINKEKYPERFNKVVALIEEKENEATFTIPEKDPYAKTLHTPLQMFVGSYWGGPLYAVYAIRKNFISLGDEKKAADSLKYGAAFILLLLAVMPFIPDSLPNMVIPVIYCVLGKLLVEKYHLKKDAINQSVDFVYESNWKIFGLGLITLTAFFAISMVWIMSLNYSGLL